jgi:integrase
MYANLYAFLKGRDMLGAMLIKRGKTYHTRLMYEGRLYQKSLKTRNNKEAVSLEAVFRASLVRGEFNILDSARTPTLEKFQKRMFEHLKNTVKPNTYSWYEYCFGTLIQFDPLGRARLDRIDTPLIEYFVQRRLKDGVGVITVNHALRTLRRALKIAEDWKLVRRAPKIKLLRGENSREYVISEEVLKSMLAWESSRRSSSIMLLLLPFLVDTGLRITEARELRRNTVSLDPKPGAELGWVRVERGKSKYSKRFVPLTQRAASSLKSALDISQCEHVFTTAKGRRGLSQTHPTHQFHKIVLGLGLPKDCVLHSTRHTFCTRLGESGADAFTIQRLAGHSSITVSQRYVHPTPERMENAISRMSELRIAAESATQS